MYEKLKLRDRCTLQINLDHVNKTNTTSETNVVTQQNINIGGDHKVKPKVKVESVYIRNFYD